MTRKFSSTSVETTLASGISNSATSMTVVTGTGSALLGGVTLAAGNVDQFTVAIDPDTTNEEIVFITAAASDTFTIVRGRAGTTAITHSAGASVKHVLTSDDLNAFNTAVSPVSTIQFAGSSSGTLTVQGPAVAGTNTVTFPAVTDTLVSMTATQALSNKDLTSGSNTFPSNLVTTTATQTLTNKTLTSPTVDTPTVNAPAINLSINAQTGTTYTLALADNGKLITLSNASAITVTIPTNASVAFPVGAQVHLQQIGDGQVTVVGAGGVTLNSIAPNLRIKWSAASLIKTATDTWTLMGDITN